MSYHGLMNERQRRFVEAYLAEPSATNAAVQAGYSERTAYSQGSRLLKHPEVSAELSRRQARLRATSDVRVDEIVLQLNQTRVDPAVPHRERLKAIELLGKYLGMFSDRHDHRVLHATLPEGLTLQELRALAQSELPRWSDEAG